MRLLFALALLPACGKVFVSDTDVLPLYDQDQDGFYAPEASAVGQSGPYDCDDGEPAIHPGAADPCDGVDNDCDGTADNGSQLLTFAYDADQDGFGDDANVREACTAPDGFVALGGDCDDADDAVHPNALEVCDGVDDDCDGAIDAADDDLVDGTFSWRDVDGDGYGDPDEPVTECGVPTGYVEDDQDCDDDAVDVHPSATEICNGYDDDCDGRIDDEDDVASAPTWYQDFDADGVGGDVLVTSCVAPAGYVASTGDCHDDDATAYPGAAERCDEYDHDCDGLVEEAESVDAGAVYADLDFDGYGAGTSSTGCVQTGWAATADDCDDTNVDVSPGASEICADGLDDDCDGYATPCSYGTSIDESTSHSFGIGEPGYDMAATRSHLVVLSLTAVQIWDMPRTWTSATAYSADAGYLTDWTAASDGSVVIANLTRVWDGIALTDGNGYVYVESDLASTAFSEISSTADVTIQNAGTRLTVIPNTVTYDNDTLVSGDPASDAVYIFGDMARQEGNNVAADISVGSVTGNPGTSFGAALRGRVDLDGDGDGDLVVGAPDVSSGKGAAFVFLTTPSGATDESAADVQISGSSSLSSFASSFADAGDLNGDGYDDLVVGAPDDDASGYRDAGATYCFFGPVTSTTSSADYAVLGQTIDAHSGTSVALSDLTDDGTDDLLIGAELEQIGAFDASAGGVVASTTPAITFSWYAGYGMMVGGVDVNGDYKDDFLVDDSYYDSVRVFERDEL